MKNFSSWGKSFGKSFGSAWGSIKITSTGILVWMGAWIKKPVKVWDGTKWKTATVKVWDNNWKNLS